VLIRTVVAGRKMAITTSPIASISLHAVARRFQRSRRTTEETVLQELGRLALRRYPETADAGGEFSWTSRTAVGSAMSSRAARARLW
jgi:hypothetical protein